MAPIAPPTVPPREWVRFSKHSFRLIAQAHNASIIRTRPALPGENGFVLQNVMTRSNQKRETRNQKLETMSKTVLQY
jgi:hypothetical protein